MSDRLTLAHAFEDAGIAREKAEAVATAVLNAIRDNVATKADVQASETKLTAQIAGEAARLDARISSVRAELVLVEHRLLTRLGGLMVVLAGLLFAALHLWPPR